MLIAIIGWRSFLRQCQLHTWSAGLLRVLDLLLNDGLNNTAMTLGKSKLTATGKRYKPGSLTQTITALLLSFSSKCYDDKCMVKELEKISSWNLTNNHRFNKQGNDIHRSGGVTGHGRLHGCEVTFSLLQLPGPWTNVPTLRKVLFPFVPSPLASRTPPLPGNSEGGGSFGGCWSHDNRAYEEQWEQNWWYCAEE